MHRGLLLAALVAAPAAAQINAEPQYQLTGKNYASEAPAIQQMFYNDAGAVQSLQSQIAAVKVAASVGGSSVSVVSPLSGNGSSGNPIALTGAIPSSLVNLSTVPAAGSCTLPNVVTATNAGAAPTCGQPSNVTGNAATVTTNANLTGNVTSVGNATTIVSLPAISGANLTGVAFSGGTVPNQTTFQSTVTIQGNAFSVGGSTLVVGMGGVEIGTSTLSLYPLEIVPWSRLNAAVGLPSSLVFGAAFYPHDFNPSISAGALGGSFESGIPLELNGSSVAFFDSGNLAMVVSSYSWVGIGTSFPAVPLDVRGAIQAASSMTASAFFGEGSHLTNITGGNVNGNISGNAANVTGTVAIVNGGTGATTAAGARANLGIATTGTLLSGTYAALKAQAVPGVAIAGFAIDISEFVVYCGSASIGDQGWFIP